jgi:very-short-patch-repair endonuclease
VRFRRQGVVAAYILDFFAPSIGLAIEVDGAAHTAPDVQAARRRAWDRARDLKLARLGIVVLRISNIDVLHRIDTVLATIRHAIAQQRGGQP